MNYKISWILTGFLIICTSGYSAVKRTGSYYTLKPEDPGAVYFTPEVSGSLAEGKTDVSVQLQNAINQLKTDRNFGILFIP